MKYFESWYNIHGGHIGYNYTHTSLYNIALQVASVRPFFHINWCHLKALLKAMYFYVLFHIIKWFCMHSLNSYLLKLTNPKTKNQVYFFFTNSSIFWTVFVLVLRIIISIFWLLVSLFCYFNHPCFATIDCAVFF